GYVARSQWTYRSAESPKRSTAASARSSGTAAGIGGVRDHHGGRVRGAVLVARLRGAGFGGSGSAFLAALLAALRGAVLAGCRWTGGSGSVPVAFGGGLGPGSGAGRAGGTCGATDSAAGGPAGLAPGPAGPGG